MDHRSQLSPAPCRWEDFRPQPEPTRSLPPAPALALPPFVPPPQRAAAPFVPPQLLQLPPAPVRPQLLHVPAFQVRPPP
jgi:hypothetical protein